MRPITLFTKIASERTGTDIRADFEQTVKSYRSEALSRRNVIASRLAALEREQADADAVVASTESFVAEQPNL